MNIETKYNIGDTVRPKFNQDIELFILAIEIKHDGVNNPYVTYICQCQASNNEYLMVVKLCEEDVLEKIIL